MTLRWKDILATATLLVVLLITYALLRGLEWPFLINLTTGMLALLIISLGMFILMDVIGVPKVRHMEYHQGSSINRSPRLLKGA